MRNSSDFTFMGPLSSYTARENSEGKSTAYKLGCVELNSCSLEELGGSNKNMLVAFLEMLDPELLIHTWD